MKTVDKAYAAGAIDADGYVTIHKTKRAHGRVVYHSALLGFTNTSPLVPHYLRKLFGGRVNEYQPPNPRHKRWFMWTADGNVAYRALMLLAKYLLLKRKQARLVIAFVRLCQRQKAVVRRNGGRLTPALVGARDRFWSSVGRLNAPRNRRVHFD